MVKPTSDSAGVLSTGKETAGFEWLLNEAMKRAYVAAYRFMRNRDAAQEAVQEAAARALTARLRYDSSRPFYPWFYRILKNHCIDLLGKRGRLAPDSERTLERAVATTGSAEQAVIQSERERAVARAIERLPEDLREIIELRHFQDLSYEEMASVLDCPLGTVMSRLYRARKTMRGYLQKDPEFRRGNEGRIGGVQGRRDR